MLPGYELTGIVPALNMLLEKCKVAEQMCLAGKTVLCSLLSALAHLRIMRTTHPLACQQVNCLSPSKLVSKWASMQSMESWPGGWVK